jgi:hypothetical protein
VKSHDDSIVRAAVAKRASASIDGRGDEYRCLGGWLMRAVRWLAVLPFLGMLVGPFFLNRVSPSVLGMPFLLAWLVAWILLTAAIMALIFWLDPENQDTAP